MRSLLLAGLSGALLLTSSYGENLLQNGGFELPKVSGRTPETKGGNPSLSEESTSWSSLVGGQAPKGGKITVGLTDEIAHAGKQCLFVDFEKLTAPKDRAALTSDLLPVKPEGPYRISIWGRIDRKRPIAMDERRPHMLVEVEFFAADQETQVGDTEYRVQMIPGNVLAGVGPKLLFVSGKWTEYHTEIKTPAEAAFMKVAFGFETAQEEGETDGVLFLDEAAVEGERGTVPLTDGEPASEEAADKQEAPASTAPATPAAAAPKSAK